MEDLVGVLLEVILQLVAELLLSLTAESIVSGASRLIRYFFGALRELGPVLGVIFYSIVGLASGFLSLLAFPHPLVHPSRFHGISLLISPLLTGAIMAWFGKQMRDRGKRSEQIETFSFGFAFAFAMALVRLIWAS